MINTYHIKSNGSKVQNLFDFLEANKNEDEGDAWFFWLDHQIKNHLENFNLEESIELERAIIQWDDKKNGHIADPLLEVNNPLIDGKALYAEIFISNHDPEWAEYLIQNIHVINNDTIRSNELYQKVLSKIEYLEKILNRDYTYYKNQIKSKL